MVLFSFVGGAAVYRANLHMAVVALLEAVNKQTRKALLALVDLCMLATALFMLGYGAHLVVVTWHQVIAEFPGLSVGITYLPIPIGGLITVFFIVERVWCGEPRAPRSCTATSRWTWSSGWTSSSCSRSSRSCARSESGRVLARPLGARRRAVDRHPLEAVMLKISDGVDNFSLLAIPFFVLAGAIMAEAAWRGAW